MPLFVLRPRESPAEASNPWLEAFCDLSLGFVVRAETAAQAREVAYNSTDHADAKHARWWLDVNLSTCELIPTDGPMDLILADRRHMT
jgi:hypothetical protein